MLKLDRSLTLAPRIVWIDFQSDFFWPLGALLLQGHEHAAFGPSGAQILSTVIAPQ